MLKRLLRSCLAILVLQGAVFGHAAETSLWDQRRRNISPSSAPAQEAKVQNPGLESLLASLPYKYGTVRDLSAPGNDPGKSTQKWVVLVQDVHGNGEAQKNIAGVIHALTESKKVSLVGLEGAFEDLEVGAFHFLPSGAVLPVASYLLEKNQISGPVFGGLTESGSVPAYWGVDDAESYRKNVKAYLQASSQGSEIQRNLTSWEKVLSEKAAGLKNPSLSVFQKKLKAYHEGRLPLAEYASFLVSQSAEESAGESLAAFLSMQDREKELNDNEVNRERQNVLTRLYPLLTLEETRTLAARASALRQGALGLGKYQDYFQDLCQRKGISLKGYPRLRAYIAYTKACETFSPKDIWRDLRNLELKTGDKLARSPEEKEFLGDVFALTLIKKLTAFSLTTDEWRQVESLNRVPKDLDLSAFKDFYRAAESRNRAMAGNLDRIMKNQKAACSVLVAGGFHAEGIAGRLNRLGIGVISFVPRAGAVNPDDRENYFNLFAQDKTPLEKLFEGQKISLAHDPFPRSARIFLMVFCLAQWMRQIGRLPGWAQRRAAALLNGLDVTARIQVLKGGVVLLVWGKNAKDTLIDQAGQLNLNLRFLGGEKKSESYNIHHNLIAVFIAGLFFYATSIFISPWIGALFLWPFSIWLNTWALLTIARFSAARVKPYSLMDQTRFENFKADAMKTSSILDGWQLSRLDAASLESAARSDGHFFPGGTLALFDKEKRRILVADWLFRRLDYSSSLNDLFRRAQKEMSAQIFLQEKLAYPRRQAFFSRYPWLRTPCLYLLRTVYFAYRFFPNPKAIDSNSIPRPAVWNQRLKEIYAPGSPANEDQILADANDAWEKLKILPGDTVVVDGAHPTAILAALHGATVIVLEKDAAAMNPLMDFDTYRQIMDSGGRLEFIQSDLSEPELRVLKYLKARHTKYFISVDKLPNPNTLANLKNVVPLTVYAGHSPGGVPPWREYQKGLASFFRFFLPPMTEAVLPSTEGRKTGRIFVLNGNNSYPPGTSTAKQVGADFKERDVPFPPKALLLVKPMSMEDRRRMAELLIPGSQSLRPEFQRAFPYFRQELEMVRDLLEGEDPQTVFRRAQDVYEAEEIPDIMKKLERIEIQFLREPLPEPGRVSEKTISGLSGFLGGFEEMDDRGVLNKNLPTAFGIYSMPEDPYQLFHEILELLKHIDPAFELHQRVNNAIHTYAALAETGLGNRSLSPREMKDIGGMSLTQLKRRFRKYRDAVLEIFGKFPKDQDSMGFLREYAVEHAGAVNADIQGRLISGGGALLDQQLKNVPGPTARAMRKILATPLFLNFNWTIDAHEEYDSLTVRDPGLTGVRFVFRYSSPGFCDVSYEIGSKALPPTRVREKWTVSGAELLMNKFQEEVLWKKWQVEFSSELPEVWKSYSRSSSTFSIGKLLIFLALGYEWSRGFGFVEAGVAGNAWSWILSSALLSIANLYYKFEISGIPSMKYGFSALKERFLSRRGDQTSGGQKRIKENLERISFPSRQA